jgi:hypothetical protein
VLFPFPAILGRKYLPRACHAFRQQLLSLFVNASYYVKSTMVRYRALHRDLPRAIDISVVAVIESWGLQNVL